MTGEGTFLVYEGPAMTAENFVAEATATTTLSHPSGPAGLGLARASTSFGVLEFEVRARPGLPFPVAFLVVIAQTAETS